ncbi:MAG: hypothetical protein SZ59_C0002G0368 [candidate division TM6 bacterium GW2011_GWF2_28_16]|nr:MAG: hypothetical protein SZ59_C0002G0368 [candidate division TM6 bacterium GW2011_GWF2_28_16]
MNKNLLKFVLTIFLFSNINAMNNTIIHKNEVLNLIKNTLWKENHSIDGICIINSNNNELNLDEDAILSINDNSLLIIINTHVLKSEIGTFVINSNAKLILINSSIYNSEITKSHTNIANIFKKNKPTTLTTTHNSYSNQIIELTQDTVWKECYNEFNGVCLINGNNHQLTLENTGFINISKNSVLFFYNLKLNGNSNNIIVSNNSRIDAIDSNIFDKIYSIEFIDLAKI